MSSSILMNAECPDGVHPFFMANSGAEKYELKVGPGIVDLIDSKRFNRDEILDEIKALGFMCPFDVCKQYISQCVHQEFIVVCDPSSKFGEMFLLLYSQSAIDDFNQATINAKKEDEENLVRLEEARIAEKAAEEALLNAVYEDKPFHAKPYRSHSAEDTEKEVNDLNDRIKSRSRVIIERKVISNESNVYNDRNHNVSGIIEFQPIHVPDFDLFENRTDVGVQSNPKKMETSSQTTNSRTKNRCTQYQAIKSHGADTNHVSNSLKNVFQLLETALQQNETLNIFSEYSDVMSDFITDRSSTRQSSEISLKEIRTCIDLKYSKGKVINSIECHPEEKGIVAVSLCASKSKNEQILSMNNSLTSSFIVLWDFSKWIKPRCFLKSPIPCSVFKFNPTSPSFVAAGCDNGQVVLWSLSSINFHDENLKASLQVNEDKTIPDSFAYGNMAYLDNQDEIQPYSISTLSHRRMVRDICWLPPTIQIDSRGKRVPKEYLDNNSYQFLSVAGDGQISVWDIRHKEIIAGKLPYLAKIRPRKGLELNDVKNFNSLKPCWCPLYTIKPKRPEKFEQLSPCKIVFHRNHPVNESKNDEHQVLEKLISCSEEGDIFELVFNQSSANENDMFDSSDHVNWVSLDHQRPTLSLQCSPFLPGLYLTVSDWEFHLWNDRKTDEAIFVSPRTKTRLTGGLWSSSRPGIILLSRCDGSIEVWDLLYSLCDPRQTMNAVPTSITSMKFVDLRDKSNILSMGDSDGSLYLFELPDHLVKQNECESRQMLNFVERETKKNSLASLDSQKDSPNLYRAKHSDRTKTFTKSEIEGSFEMLEKNLVLELGINLQVEDAKTTK